MLLQHFLKIDKGPMYGSGKSFAIMKLTKKPTKPL
jgi:hypothetical protein